MGDLDESVKDEWVRLLKKQGIFVGKQEAPTFVSGAWEFWLSKVRRYRGLTYNYGGRNKAWIWQPTLREFMGEPLGPRDRAKRCYFYRDLAPDDFKGFLQQLMTYERDFSPTFQRKVATANRLWKTAEQQTTFLKALNVVPHLPPETTLHQQMYAQKGILERSLGIRLVPANSWPQELRGRSKPDLVGVDKTDGRFVIIEVKLKHLKYATVEALEYARNSGSRDGVKAMYISAAPTRSEVVRSKVLTHLYRIPVSVVQYLYYGGKLQYQICT